MTVFAICMTAVAAFLLGFNVARVKIKKADGKVKCQFSEKTAPAYLTSEEYLNFLSYDGSEQA